MHVASCNKVLYMLMYMGFHHVYLSCMAACYTIFIPLLSYIGKLDKGATKAIGSDKEEVVQEPDDAVDG